MQRGSGALANPKPMRTGLDRLNFVLSLYKGDQNSQQYADYVMNLPEDPNDPLYTQLLRQTKARVRAQAAQPSLPANPQNPDALTMQLQGQQNPQAPPGYTGTPVEPVSSGIPQNQRDMNSQVRNDAADARQRKLPTKTRIVGLTQNDFSSQTQGQQSAALQQFANGQDIQYSDNEKDARIHSGNYVYMGSDTDAKGQTTDNYYSVDDAKADIMTWSPKKVKQIQAKLGMPQTGVVDKDLFGMWSDAVELAALAARRGVKVSPEFLFEQSVAARAAGGGGGGGGAGARQLGASDYYMMMQQVMGDISGVKGGPIG